MHGEVMVEATAAPLLEVEASLEVCDTLMSALLAIVSSVAACFCHRGNGKGAEHDIS
jgi:hypothetical protein